MKLLKDAYDKAVTLLRENMEALDRISEFLIEKETITGKEFMDIFNKVRAERGEPLIGDSGQNGVKLEKIEDAGK